MFVRVINYFVYVNELFGYDWDKFVYFDENFNSIVIVGIVNNNIVIGFNVVNSSVFIVNYLLKIYVDELNK